MVRKFLRDIHAPGRYPQFIQTNLSTGNETFMSKCDMVDDPERLDLVEIVKGSAAGTLTAGELNHTAHGC